MNALSPIDRLEAVEAKLSVRELGKVLWAKAGAIVERERGPRPTPQTHRLEPSPFPAFASVAMASAELDVFSAALEWDRAKRDTHRRLALAEGFEVTDTGLVPQRSQAGRNVTARGA